MSATEYEILEKYKPLNLIDIGCSNGRRFFDYFINSKINFIGLEKFSHICEAAPEKWKNKIINCDISASNLDFFSFGFTQQADMAIMFCYAFGGLQTLLARETAVKNISKFLKKDGLFVLDNYLIPGFWEKAIGISQKISPYVPNQYFPSYREIKELCLKNGLILKEDPLSYCDEDNKKIYLIFVKIA